MANTNLFTLLHDDEEDDFTAAKYASSAPLSPAKATPPPPKKPSSLDKPQPKFPSKPLPPAEAVKFERDSQQPERYRGRGRGRGRGWSGGEGGGDSPFPNRGGGDSYYQGRGGDYQGRGDYQSRGGDYQSRGDYQGRGDSPYSPGRGGRGGGRGGYRGYGDSAEGEGERRFEGGYGRGRGRRGGESWDSPSWETPTPEPGITASQEEVKEPEAVKDEKPEGEEKVPEKPEMTLDEYYNKMKSKQTNLPKPESRKVEVDAEFQKMQLVDKKHDTDFIKLGIEKEKIKKRDASEKEKKKVPITEFLKPARSRAKGGRGYYGRGGTPTGPDASPPAAPADNGSLSPSINSPQEFPELGKK